MGKGFLLVSLKKTSKKGCHPKKADPILLPGGRMVGTSGMGTRQLAGTTTLKGVTSFAPEGKKMARFPCSVPE